MPLPWALSFSTASADPERRDRGVDSSIKEDLDSMPSQRAKIAAAHGRQRLTASAPLEKSSVDTNTSVDVLSSQSPDQDLSSSSWGDKPHVCEDCGSSFSNRSNLRRHRRTHTKEKPFTCDLCLKCFSQSSNLRTHLRCVHKIERTPEEQAIIRRQMRDDGFEEEPVTRTRAAPKPRRAKTTPPEEARLASTESTTLETEASMHAPTLRADILGAIAAEQLRMLPTTILTPIPRRAGGSALRLAGLSSSGGLPYINASDSSASDAETDDEEAGANVLLRLHAQMNVLMGERARSHTPAVPTAGPEIMTTIPTSLSFPVSHDHDWDTVRLIGMKRTADVDSGVDSAVEFVQAKRGRLHGSA